MLSEFLITGDIKVFENIDNEIYHFTKILNILSIAESGVLRAGQQFDKNFISFTRNKFMNKDTIWAKRKSPSVCIVFDKTAMEDKGYKPRPFNLAYYKNNGKDKKDLRRTDNRAEERLILKEKELPIKDFIKRIVVYKSYLKEDLEESLSGEFAKDMLVILKKAGSDITDITTEYDPIEDVRILKYRNGNSMLEFILKNSNRVVEDILSKVDRLGYEIRSV